MAWTIHTSAWLDGRLKESYAPAYIPKPGEQNIDGKIWDFAKLVSYVSQVGRGTEIDLILRTLYRGGVGRIAFAVDGKETVVYRVMGSYKDGVHWHVSAEELKTYDYLLPEKEPFLG